MRKSYPSDVSREQFESIRPFLDDLRKATRPRKVDLYDVFCAILYILASGCQWRMLPGDFPKWTTVYFYWRQWNKKDADGQTPLEKALEQKVKTHRTAENRQETTSFIIVDSQSVPNTNTAHVKGYDGGKQVSGIKRHIGVDTQGLPHVLGVTPANVDDRQGILEAIWAARPILGSVQNVLGDGGYTGGPFAESIDETIQATVQIGQRSSATGFQVIPKRWIVERSFAWLENCRRLWKNCERKINTSLQFMNLAFLSLLLKRL